VHYLQDKFEYVTDKPWALELSGRALSLAADIRSKAEQAAANLGGLPRFRFHDVIYGHVGRFLDHGNLAVFIEPNCDDKAHANLVIIEEPKPIQYLRAADAKKPHEIYRQIAERLEVCDASDLTPLEALRPQS